MEHADGDQGRAGGDISEEGDPMNAGSVGRDAAGRAGLFECALVGSGTLLIRCAELLLRNGHAIRRVVSDDLGVRRCAAQQGIVHGDDVAGLAEQPFDYLFSVLNGLVLAPDVLRWPRRAAINYHDAPLPRYGGMHVTSWALINRETSYAVTWHLMAERVDAGAILKQWPVAIAPRETALTLNAACYQAAFAAFGELLAELEAGTAVARVQDPSQRTFFARYKRPPMAGVFSPTWPASRSAALVRALTFGPYVNGLVLAKLHVQGAYLGVGALDVLPTASTAPPGTVVALDGPAVRLATADDDIALRCLITVDGAPLTPTEAAARYGLRVGDRVLDPSPDVAARLNVANAALCRHERYWVTVLEDARPFQAPQMGWHGWPSGLAGAPRRALIPLPPLVVAGVTRAVAASDASAVLVTAWAAYLARLSGGSLFDLALADLAARRLIVGLEGVFAVRTPLRIEVAMEGDIAALVASVGAGLAAARLHLTYARDVVTRYPALRAAAERAGHAPLGSSFGVDIVADLADCPQGEAPLYALVVVEGAADAYCAYDPSGMASEDAERLTSHFVTFLRGLATDLGHRLADLPLLNDAERHHLLVGWNPPGQPTPPGLCVHHLVQEQAARTPDAVAVVGEHGALTYGQLDRQANRLARHLRGLGVGPESLVGLCLERSPDMIVALLAVLKAGGGYLPLDPSYPPGRLAAMVADAHVVALLTDRLLRGLLRGLLPAQGPPIVCLDTDGPAIALHNSAEALPPLTTGTNTAYVLYTSGSTGQPRGVVVEHAALAHYTLVAAEAFALTPADRVLQFAALSFDAAAEEIYPCLIREATLVMRPAAMLDGLPTFLQTCQDLRLSVLDLPTAYWHELVCYLAEADATTPPGVRLVVIGGEAVQPERLRQWHRQAPGHPRLLNTYGPTETTVAATLADLTNQPENQLEGSGPVSIGRPFPGAQAYILDAYGQPSPIGVPGELYIGGPGLARGYLGRPDLTAERFIAHPFSAQTGARLFRTGDRARYSPNGQIAFLGRADDQVKISGYRIEPGEVEATLAAQPGVRAAAVVVREDMPGDRRLVAYVALRSPDSGPEDIRRALALSLPPYMMPAVVVLPQLPFTPGGKLDRAALPPPDHAGPTEVAAGVAPRDGYEHRLAALWSRRLHGRPVGVTDNFFDLGGHSLLAIALLGDIAREFSWHIPLATFLGEATVERVAGVLRQYQRDEGAATLVTLQPRGIRPPFFCAPARDGSLAYYSLLAHHLGPDQPVYGLQALPTRLQGAAPPTMRDLATHYARAIRSLRPEGPYHLGGYSSGGVLAFEIAHCLRAAGQEVGLLVLFDTLCPTPEGQPVDWPTRLPRLRDRAIHHATVWASLPPGARSAYMLGRGRGLAGRVARACQALRPAPPVPAAPAAGTVVALADPLSQVAPRQVAPRPYPGRITLFVSRHTPRRSAHAADPRLRWGQLAGQGVELHWFPGDH